MLPRLERRGRSPWADEHGSCRRACAGGRACRSSGDDPADAAGRRGRAFARATHVDPDAGAARCGSPGPGPGGRGRRRPLAGPRRAAYRSGRGPMPATRAPRAMTGCAHEFVLEAGPRRLIGPRAPAASSLDPQRDPERDQRCRAYRDAGRLCLVRPLVSRGRLVGSLAIHRSDRDRLGQPRSKHCAATARPSRSRSPPPRTASAFVVSPTPIPSPVSATGARSPMPWPRAPGGSRFCSSTSTA